MSCSDIKIFTSVCQEFCPLAGGWGWSGGGVRVFGRCLPLGPGGVYLWFQGVSASGSSGCVCLWVWGCTPSRQTHPRQTPLLADTPPGQTLPLGRRPPLPERATAASGTHATGMHSCFMRML